MKKQSKKKAIKKQPKSLLRRILDKILYRDGGQPSKWDY